MTFVASNFKLFLSESMDQVISFCWRLGLLRSVGFVALTVFSGCKVPGEASSSLDAAPDSHELADARWLNKAARALRLGKGLGPDEPIKAFVGQPKSEILDALMKDPRFFPTMIDFYSFYYGFKSADGVREQNILSTRLTFDPKTKTLRIASGGICPGSPLCLDYPVHYRIDRTLSGHPAAISSAVAVVEGRSLEVSYRPEQPAYLPVDRIFDILTSLYISLQPSSKRSETDPSKMESVQWDSARRTVKQALANVQKLVQSEISRVDATGSMSSARDNEIVEGFCTKLLAFEEKLSVMFVLAPLISTDFLMVCLGSREVPLVQVKKMRDQLALVEKTVDDAFLFLEQFLNKKLKVNHGTYIDATPYLKHAKSPSLYGDSFWETHTNSSTNYNRRRAAYVLKTFLCDDLTPVKLEQAKHPGDNRHASDPACMACHYKLDPIAGFFRDYGTFGIKFPANGAFVFDDMKQISGQELQKYRASWDFPNKKGPNGGLNIGLVRSTTDPSKNSYGATLEDLGRLIARDPRTHTCTTQRLADYFIGAGQTYDSRWIDSLASELTSAPQATNGQALKRVIKRILMSKAFSTQNPEEGVCYDQGPSSSQNSKRDCRVASTIDKYCVKCHGSSGDSGGLNLSQWSESRGFVHQDDSGKPYTLKVSYQRILERLGPSKQGPIMPLNSPMPDPDRHVIKQWFETQLKKIK